MTGQVIPIFTAPSAREREALDLTASYLKRAGNEAATRLMAAHALEFGKAELIESLRDEMRESAALCECLIDLFDDWGAPSFNGVSQRHQAELPVTHEPA